MDPVRRHPLEFEATKKFFDLYIPRNSTIIDIGGGPGRYALYLNSQGHHVTLLDLSLENLNYAQTKAAECNVKLDGYIHANVLDLHMISNETYSYFETVIETGFNNGNIDQGFTDSYFFDPQAIEPFLNHFPFKKLLLTGVEGLFAQSEAKLLNLTKDQFQMWLNFSLKYSSHSSILGASQHILYIGRKNNA